MRMDHQRCFRVLFASCAVAALLVSATTVGAAGSGKMTGIALLPSNQIPQGTTVTVKLTGTGQCQLSIETNGASDVDGGYGDYHTPMGPFPQTVSFQANKPGSFQIAAFGSAPDHSSCAPEGHHAMTVLLIVLERGQK